jgi:hypothetical protein
MLDRKQIDFLYWHAVSKMRMGEFKDAGILFRMLRAACPQRHDVGLGHAYSLMRQGALEEAHAVVAELRRHPMRSEEMALLGRLHRRCDFERQRRARRALERAPTRPMSGVVA